MATDLAQVASQILAGCTAVHVSTGVFGFAEPYEHLPHDVLKVLKANQRKAIRASMAILKSGERPFVPTLQTATCFQRGQRSNPQPVA